MSRVAVFIDAGYFWVQATHVVLGARGPRASLTIDYATLHKKVLDEVAAQFPGKDLLRVYWYDGPDANGSKGPDHLAIDLLDDFKLRLGTRNVTGQQKAVDGMLISDLLTFAQSRAIENAILITGDADLTPGVVSAQALGLRVHLIIIGPPTSTSPYLSAEVDKKVVWDPSVVASFAKPAAAQAATAPAKPAAQPAQKPQASQAAQTNTPAKAAAPAAAPAEQSEAAPAAAPACAAAPQTEPRERAPAQPAAAGHAQKAAAQTSTQQAPAQQPPAAPAPNAGTSGKALATEQVNAAQADSTPSKSSASSTAESPPLADLAEADFKAIAVQARDKFLAGPNAGLLATAPAGALPLPKIVDRAVLRAGMAHARRMLSEPEKRQLRIAFKALL